VVVNHGDKAQLWRNTSTNAGHWIEIKLEQPAPNRDVIGAWIEVKRGDKIMRREITVGGGHASGQSGWWHFGLGDASKIEFRVIWPDGNNSDWQSVDSNNFYVLDRSKPKARLWRSP
jgi:enediyne biosynthesis protein E4